MIHQVSAVLAMLTMVVAVLSGPVQAQSGGYGGAMNWYERQAEKGDAKAQFLLGILYERGAGPREKSAELAFGWFLKAATQGHAQAQYKTGIAYQSGIGTPADEAKAVGWYRRAAGQGLSEAQNLTLILI